MLLAVLLAGTQVSAQDDSASAAAAVVIPADEFDRGTPLRSAEDFVAASEWTDESGLTWLDRPPKIKLLPVTDARKPYPLSWEAQLTSLIEAANKVVGQGSRTGNVKEKSGYRVNDNRLI